MKQSELVRNITFYMLRRFISFTLRITLEISVLSEDIASALCRDISFLTFTHCVLIC